MIRLVLIIVCLPLLAMCGPSPAPAEDPDSDSSPDTNPAVTLDKTSDEGASFLIPGDCVGECGDAGQDPDVASAPPPDRLVFVTSRDLPGDLGLNPDVFCNLLADEAGLIRRYPHPDAPAGSHRQDRFRAWISAELSASERLYHAVSTYRRLDGKAVADGWAMLAGTGQWDGPTGPELLASISIADDLTERFVGVRTGSMPDGSRGITTCGGFTTIEGSGVVGVSNRTDGGWSNIGTADCDAELALYCIETYRGEVEDPKWQCLPGRDGEVCKPKEYW